MINVTAQALEDVLRSELGRRARAPRCLLICYCCVVYCVVACCGFTTTHMMLIV